VPGKRAGWLIARIRISQNAGMLQNFTLFLTTHNPILPDKPGYALYSESFSKEAYRSSFAPYGVVFNQNIIAVTG